METASDLAAPRRPEFVEWVNASGRALAPGHPRLDPDRLMSAARRGTGLGDFGDDRFLEPLRVLCDSLEAEAALNLVGRFNVRLQLFGLLRTRLRATRLRSRHPEILETPVERPIVIVGLPRTGTTFLQRLLAQDAGLRHLPYWEALAPLPLKDCEHPPQRAADPRVRRAEQSLAFLHRIAPEMISMHEMETSAPDEEIWLMAASFASMLFEAGYFVPSYGEWFAEADVTWAYRELVSMLQVLQWYTRDSAPQRWLLKSPQHLAKLPSLLAVMGDATVVQTHRDPVTVTASLASMVSYGARMNTDRPDPARIGHHWAHRVESLLRSSVRDRPLGDQRFVDVMFPDLLADPIGETKRIFDAAGRELAPDTERSMRAWLEANPRGKHGSHRYRLEDFGLDRQERRTALQFYSDAFGVPDEPEPGEGR